MAKAWTDNWKAPQRRNASVAELKLARLKSESIEYSCWCSVCTERCFNASYTDLTSCRDCKRGKHAQDW